MFFLRVLGGAGMQGPAGPVGGRAAQRRRLALLALLALSPGRSLSRDKLTGYLWPEHGDEQARRLLTVSVYEIRRALGEEALRTNGDEVVLGTAAVRVDAIEFRLAVDLDEWDRAVALYSGPFLDGFFVADAPEFERWVDAEREHLARQFRVALERLAEQRERCGDAPGAVDAWRRLAAEDPFCGRVAVGLMRALESAGDRAGAIQHAGVHAALLREELVAEPDADVAAMADRLRRESRSASERGPGRPGPSEEASPPAAVGNGPVGAELEPAAALTAPAAASPASARVLHVADWSRRARGLPPLLGILALLLLVVLGVGGTLSAWQRQPTASGLVANRVAVLPFRVQGAAEYAYLEAGLVDLLSRNLDGAGELRSVDPHALQSFITGQRLTVADPGHGDAVAARFGAGLYVMGTVSAVAGRLRLMASLYETGRTKQPVAQAMVDGDVDEVFAMVDRLTSRLLAERLVGPASRLERQALAATSSVAAFKAYLEGEQFLRAGQFASAIEAFGRAAAEDSTFALAYYRLCVAAEWGARRDVVLSAASTALRLDHRLPPGDRDLLHAFLAWQSGDAADAERRYGAILDHYPDDVEARFQLAEVLFHYNPFRGRPATESRRAWERVLALAPDNRFAVVHLARLDAFEGMRASLDQRWHRIRELDSDDDPRVTEILALRALANGDTAAERRAAERIQRLDGVELMQMASYLAGFSRNLAGVRRLTAGMTEPARSPATRFAGHLQMGYLDVAMGRQLAGRQQLDGAARIDPTSASLHAALLATSSVLPASAAELEELRTRIDGFGDAVPADFLGVNTGIPPLLPVARDYAVGLLSLGLDDLETTRSRIRRLDSTVGPWWLVAAAHDMAHGLRARVALREGDPVSALRELEQIRMEETPYSVARTTPFRGRAAERFLRAEVLHRLGHLDEALRWYSSLGATSVLETVYLAPAHLRRAEIHAQRGEAEAARQHYLRFLDLRNDADPEHRPSVERARAALQRLPKPQS
jgi:DNA-binding SARP family transcriptional activator